MEVPTRARLEHLVEVLTAGTGAVDALPPQLRYAVAGVRAYLAAAAEGAPATGQLLGHAAALWETLCAAADTAAAGSPAIGSPAAAGVLPAPRTVPDATPAGATR
ncbi:hypothetical protein [Kitasatospora sp. NPDC057198]|uniref:hypothetical protein n=1 Tax=Kitasatospora sp. NPDC057198 TaxID=3346046 RepID=UPI0036383E00